MTESIAHPERNLALELVRTTEAAGMAAAPWVGRGDKIGADQAAVDAMRQVLSGVQMDGVVIIGEGEKDEAPMLFNGEKVGNGQGQKMDIAVDPIDGTTLTALGRGGALAVIAAAEAGSMFDPGPLVYMEKVAVGPEGAGIVDIRLPTKRNLEALAKAKGKSVPEITCMVLDRPRHAELLEEIRDAGARILLIADGDVGGSIATAWEGTGVDILFGIGGTPEGVITACAMKAIGGDIQGRLVARSPEEQELAEDAGYDLDAILTIDDLVSTDRCFFAATGITSGDLLKGVGYRKGVVTTQSIVMRGGTGTVRLIEARHNLSKLSGLHAEPSEFIETD